MDTWTGYSFILKIILSFFNNQDKEIQTKFLSVLYAFNQPFILMIISTFRYFKGKSLHITPHRFLHYEELLSDLSKSMSLPYGVRRIYTPIG